MAVVLSSGARSVLFTEAGVDVSGASGNCSTFSLYGYLKVSWVAELTALTGGTSPDVTFTWQHGPDGANWYDIATEAALTATGYKQRLVEENVMNYVRVRWATTGTPTTATATFLMQAMRD
jgi:hypothetical protein